VVDLGGAQVVADPLHVPRGPARQGHHPRLSPGGAAGRAAARGDRLTDAVAGRQLVRFGLVRESAVRLEDVDRIA
jgi:hypothetical protein